MIKKAVKQDQNLQRITFPPAGLNLLLSLPVSQAVLQKSRSRPEALEAVDSIPWKGDQGGHHLLFTSVLKYFFQEICGSCSRIFPDLFFFLGHLNENTLKGFFRNIACKIRVYFFQTYFIVGRD